MSCSNDKTVTDQTVITSVNYAANAKTLGVKKECKKQHSQACFFCSAVIREKPAWATLTCHQKAATVGPRFEGKATSSWSAEHTGAEWTDIAHRAHKNTCDRDEYPPAYFLHANHEAYIWGGIDTRGQLIRYMPHNDNRGAGQYWIGACIIPPITELSLADLIDKAEKGTNKQTISNPDLEITQVMITVETIPEFFFNKWGHAANPPANDGLEENKCWPSYIARRDPGFQLLSLDPWYNKKPRPYNYKVDYAKGVNGD